MREIKSSGANRTCVIRLQGGRPLELKGDEVPSVTAVLLLFKRRRAKRARLGGLKDRLAAMRRDLARREQALRGAQ